MPGQPFRPLQERELQRLDDDALIAHIRAARAAGEDEQAVLALRILVFGYMPIVRARVALRVPRADVDDVAHDAVASAVAAAFDGTSVGEFRSWLHTIVQREIADYWRRKERRPREDPLPTEHEGDERTWGREPATEDEYAVLAGTEEGALEDAIAAVLAELGPDHRRVVELYLVGERSAREVVAQVAGMTEANVYKIFERFRTAVRERLEGRPGTGGGDSG